MPLQQLNILKSTKLIHETTAAQCTRNDWQKCYDVNPFSMERCASDASTLSFSRDICRICHCEGDEESPLITPCFCAGSLRYVHQSCLQQWIKSSDTKSCELCKFVFIMQSKVKPLNKWERLDLSEMERRKIMCSVAFHIIAITCVVWSLFVLVQRTFREVKEGTLEWPFWTKVVVVAIGITGSIVFMYVQCKMYFELCRRWRAFNRVIYVQDAPEKTPLNEQEKHMLNTKGNLGKGVSLNNISLEKASGTLSVISESMNNRSINFHPSSLNSATAVCGSTRSLTSLAWTDEMSPRKFSCNNSRPSELETLIPSSDVWKKKAECVKITVVPHDSVSIETRSAVGCQSFDDETTDLESK